MCSSDLARELHDELGQHLNAIKIDAVAIRGWSGGDASAKNADVHRASLAIIEGADHVQGVIRDMLRRLRPAGLDELGLAAALEHLVQQWQARNPSTEAVLEVEDAAALEAGLSENENMTCYRLVQEALTNVTRHSGARNVHIRLVRRQAQLTITVRDDGAGAPAAERARSILPRERGVGAHEVQFLDPDVAEAHVVPLALQLQAAGGVGDAFPAVVAAVEAGVRAAPHLLDLHVGVDLHAVEEHRDPRPFGQLEIGRAHV